MLAAGWPAFLRSPLCSLHAHVSAGGVKRGFSCPSPSPLVLQRCIVDSFVGVGTKSMCKCLALVKNYGNTEKKKICLPPSHSKIITSPQASPVDHLSSGITYEAEFSAAYPDHLELIVNISPLPSDLGFVLCLTSSLGWGRRMHRMRES